MVLSALRQRKGGIAHDTVWSLASELAAFVSMILAFFLLSARLGKVGLGAYGGLFAVIGVFTAVTNGGASLTILQHIVQLREPADRVIRSVSRTVLSFGTLFSVLTSAITLTWIHDIGAVPVILLSVTELVFGSMNYLLTSSIQATRGFIPAAKRRIVWHGLRVAVLVGLWTTIGVRLVPYSILTFAVSGGYMLVLLHGMRAQIGGPVIGGSIERDHLRSVGTYSAGLTGLAVQNDGDKIALKVYGWGEDAGRYRAAYSLVQMGLLPVTALIGATHVSFLRQDQHISQLRRARRLASLSVVYGLAVAAGLWAFAPLVPKMLSDFDGTPSIIRWLSPLVLLRGTGTFAMNGLLGLGYNRLRTMLLVGNAVLAAVLYAALVRAHSWRGAVAATLISEALLFLAAWVCLIVLQRRHDRSGPVDRELVTAGLQAESDVLYGEQG